MISEQSLQAKIYLAVGCRVYAQLIEEATQEILGQVNKQLTENQLKAIIPEAFSIDLIVSSQCVYYLLNDDDDDDYRTMMMMMMMILECYFYIIVIIIHA